MDPLLPFTNHSKPLHTRAHFTRCCAIPRLKCAMMSCVSEVLPMNGTFGRSRGNCYRISFRGFRNDLCARLLAGTPLIGGEVYRGEKDMAWGDF